MCCSAAAASACSISGSTSRLSGGGWARTTAEWRRRPQCILAISAASAGLSTRAGTGGPPSRGVEERQLVSSVAEDGYAERLEDFHRRRDVEERLRPRADDERLGPGELAQVAGDVEPLAAVDAADPARAHEADASCAAGGERATDGRRPDGALNGARRQVAWAGLARVGRESCQLGFREPDADGAAQHSDGGRDRARVPDTLL